MASSEPRAAETATVEPLAGTRHELLLFAPGTRLAERYEIREVLGQGGFAVVYRAFDHQLAREIALKVLRAERLTESGLRRLEREAAIARDCASPHLVRIFDIGRAGTAVFLTLELATGGSLRDRLRAGPLPVDEALRIVRGILEGLADLHQRGVVHRDVKPGNVLFDAGDEVKLADFGLALSLDRDETRATASQALIGTVEYLSPEQILGEDATPQSDLYAVGVVLFEMLTGRLPRSGASSLGTLLAHLKDPVPDPRTLRRDVPAWLGGLLLGLLDRSPGGRPTSARTALAALDGHHGALVWWRRTWGRRALVAGAMLVAGAAGLAGWWVTRPRFDHLVQAGTWRIEALDGSGRALWSREPATLDPGTVVARLRHGEPARVVTIPPLGATASRTPLERRTLDVLDADSGKRLEQIELPSSGSSFPGYSETYGARMVAVDIDGDGLDEILVSFIHEPLWPSYTVLYEPSLRLARTVFRAPGHHHYLGVSDADGDGRRELLLAGINNRLGWFLGVAAVRLPGPTAASEIAVAPGLPPPQRSTQGLVWYALGPWGYLASQPGTVDPVSGRVELRLADGRTFALDRDGFATASLRPAAERQAVRSRAYDALAAASEARAAGDFERVRQELVVAATAAEASGDALLGEWSARQAALALVGLANPATAEQELLRLWPVSTARAELAFDAARTFHVSGDLDRALTWYRRAVREPDLTRGGRGGRELREGLVLAEVEAGRAREAQRELTSTSETGAEVNDLLPLRWFVRWRLGQSVDLTQATTMIGPSSVDLYRYWLLEWRLAAGEAPAGLLADLERLRGNTSRADGLLDSLAGELLVRLGKPTEALVAARRGFESLEGELGTETAARAHVDLALARWRRFAVEVGGDEAQAVTEAAARLAERRAREREVAASGDGGGRASG